MIRTSGVTFGKKAKLGKKKEHGDYLWIGRDKTKQYYCSLSWAHKKLHSSRLRRFGFSLLAEFLVR